MAYIATCRGPCVPNDAIPMPPYPPYWIGGGTTPPPDPNVLAVTCPTIPDTEIVGTPVTIRVLGQNFTGTCVAYLDNVAQTTNFVSATELDFDATGTVAKTSTVTVRDGGTTAQGTCQFKWTAAPDSHRALSTRPCDRRMWSGGAAGHRQRHAVHQRHRSDA